jgi:RNA polymerase sigma-70 factor, ECF subfamily
MEPQSDTVAEPAASMAAPFTFEEFFDVHHVVLFRRLCVLTGSRTEAEEVAQEAFVRLWERWGRVATVEDPEGYLYRTALNLVRRRHSRTFAFRKLVSRDRTDDALSQVEKSTAVSAALATLTRRQRAALVLTTMMGFTSEEAGRLLHVGPSTVRALATQARSALRETMEDPR